MAGKPNATLSVEVRFHEIPQGEKAPPSRAYLFDRAGRLLDSRPISEQEVTFQIQSDQAYRITVGPDLLIKTEKPPPDLAARLAKAKAISRDYIPQIGVNRFQIPIHRGIWGCWVETCILVHGRVQKLLNPGGTPAQYAPICTGTVQIFQVDLECTLDNLASFQALTLRDRLIQRLSVGLQREAAVKPIPPRPPGDRITTLGAARRAASLATAPTAAAPRESALSVTEAATTLASLEGASLKQFIVVNKAFFWFFLCELIPDEAFCWQELGEAPIQSDGTFSAEICFFCPEDFPDLYFEVVQNLDGIEREIYDPQIACSTYFDYDGSEDVVITVDDPAAVACLPGGPPGPGYLYVWPTAIGNVDLRYIDGLETGLGTGLLPNNTPWGGTLALQMQFHPDLQANNIKYYRWSYMFDGDPGFTQINASVTHRYMTVTVLPGPVIVIHLNPVTLGPQTVGGTPNLFAIPDPTLPWIDIDDPADRPFTYFDSTGGVTPRKSGMCTLMLEMFDGAGNFVPCNNTLGSSTLGDQAGDPAPPGPFTYILPDLAGPPDTFTNAPTPNTTDHGRLIFRIRVDNNATDAELPKVATPLDSTDTDPCGVLHYTTLGDNVAIYYVAFHPNNFLDWYLSVSRGISGVVASIPPSPPPNNTSSGSPGLPATFNNSAGTLLGTCKQAAFAVNLDCYARATSGYSRQSQYDSSATIAFALLTL